ncbi:hypothetical protein [Butyrivibrio sp. AC2005]|uniref:hypothetical protein n=1 Tax=Butyrivibrio sp. AC2005 TaxID=1280672 RepID=UPI00040A285A|nr:hypothetical protein [Butyrivibrio sp. AC2005]
MENGKKIVIEVNKRHLIILIIAIFLFLLVSFLFDDYPYWKSSFGFDESDKYTTKTIETWNKYGCCYFYKNDKKKALDNYDAILEDEKLVGYVKSNTAIWGIINLYSDKQISNAFNALVYGCYNSNHETGKYKSVADIPERLFRNCYIQLMMPNNMNKSIKEVYEQYLREQKELLQ